MENRILNKFNNFIERTCVVGVSHPKWDERPVVIVELKRKNGKFVRNVKSNQLKNEIIEYLKQSYAKFQLPDDVIIWKQIPISGTGKMSKKDVRKILQKQKYILPSLRKKFESNISNVLQIIYTNCSRYI